MNKQIFSLILGAAIIATTPGFAMEAEDNYDPVHGFPKTQNTSKYNTVSVLNLDDCQYMDITIREGMEYEELRDTIEKGFKKPQARLSFTGDFPDNVPKDITVETWPLLINGFLHYSREMRIVTFPLVPEKKEPFRGFPALPEGIESKDTLVVALDLPGQGGYCPQKKVTILKGMEYKDLLNNIEAQFEKPPVKLHYNFPCKGYNNVPKDITAETWPLLINGLIYYYNKNFPSYIDAYFNENKKEPKDPV
jgi:hypothetical protein